MLTSTNAKRPVLKQRVEQHSVNATSGGVNLCAWAVQQLARPVWIPVEAKEETANDAFEAVKHEHALSNQATVVREQDPSLTPIGTPTAGERYRGPRGRLLTFKKPR
jgi:hypothetical protein